MNNKTFKRPRPANLEIENAKIILKNFSGKKFPDGKRTFAILIEDENEARRLIDEGWKIKEPKNEEESWFLPVKVRFDVVPPKIYIDTANGLVPVDERTVDKFDNVRLTDVKLYITPYVREDGISAYLDTMICRLDEQRPSFMDNYRMMGE